MGLKPASVCACVRLNFKYKCLLDQGTDHNQILSEASLEWEKCCIRFGGRSVHNSGFHGNR